MALILKNVTEGDTLHLCMLAGNAVVHIYAAIMYCFFPEIQDNFFGDYGTVFLISCGMYLILLSLCVHRICINCLIKLF